MEAVKAYYDGNVFIPIEPVKAKMNQPAIIAILDEEKKADKPHLKFVGMFSEESLKEMSIALMDTQRIDSDGW